MVLLLQPVLAAPDSEVGFEVVSVVETAVGSEGASVVTEVDSTEEEEESVTKAVVALAEEVGMAAAAAAALVMARHLPLMRPPVPVVEAVVALAAATKALQVVR